MFIYVLITIFVGMLYIPLSMMWSGTGPGAPDDDDDDDDWRLNKFETIEDAFRYDRAGGDMSTGGMGDRPLE